MAEPEGLNMSLEDLIRKKQEKAFQGGRGGDRGGRGSGNLGVRGGGVQKNFGGRGGQHHNNNHDSFGQQRHGGRGNYNQGSGRGGGGFQRRGGFSGGGRGRGGGGGGYGGDRGQGGNWNQQQGQRHGQGQQQHYHSGQGHGHQQQQQQQQRRPTPIRPKCFMRQETGEVVVKLVDTEIVVVSPTGDITLDTGDFFTASTFYSMNKALNAVEMKVIANGQIEDGSWQVSTGLKLLRFQNRMVIPGTGWMAASRGPAILAAMNDQAPTEGVIAPPTAAATAPQSSLAAHATAASTAAALAAGMNFMARARMLNGGGGLAAAMPGMTNMQAAYLSNPAAMAQAAAAMQIFAAANQGLPFQAGLSGAAGTTSNAAVGYSDSDTLDPDQVRRLKAQGRL